MARTTKPEPFQFSVPDGALADLRHRLARPRFAPDLHNEDWRYGVPTVVLEPWVSAWRELDWRRAERQLNGMEQYQVRIGDVPVYFLHRRGKGPDPMPIVLTHGWPWTFWDWHATVDPLANPASYGADPADAFDVVVPALPGFPGSSPLSKPGIGYSQTADLWHVLMTEVLGYEQYGASGGDMGNVISGMLGHKYPDQVVGLHLLGAVPIGYMGSPGDEGLGTSPREHWGFTRSDHNPTHPVLREALKRPPSPRRRNPQTPIHRAIHSTEPQTLAAALHDSPVGLLAWLLRGRHTGSDSSQGPLSVFSKDFLLTTASLYWFTESFSSAARMYWESAQSPWQPSRAGMPVVTAPTGITFFAHDHGTSQSRFWCEDYYNLVRVSSQERGGHFSPAEVPDIVVNEIRSTFRLLR